jgi:hypothetical protein
MKVVAFITEVGVVDRIIDHLKLGFVAAKPPPSRVFTEVALTRPPRPDSEASCRTTKRREGLRNAALMAAEERAEYFYDLIIRREWESIVPDSEASWRTAKRCFQPVREDVPSPYAFRASFFVYFAGIDIADRQEVYSRRGQTGRFIGRGENSWCTEKSKFLSISAPGVRTERRIRGLAERSGPR